MKRKCGQSLILAVLLLVNCVDALGQPRYRPSRPTISPWLSLTDRSAQRSGSLPAYFRLVRPQQDQRAFDRAQTLEVRKLSLVDEQQTTGATGSSSVFNNRSHYFPAVNRQRIGQR